MKAVPVASLNSDRDSSGSAVTESVGPQPAKVGPEEVLIEYQMAVPINNDQITTSTDGNCSNKDGCACSFASAPSSAAVDEVKPMESLLSGAKMCKSAPSAPEEIQPGSASVQCIPTAACVDAALPETEAAHKDTAILAVAACDDADFVDLEVLLAESAVEHTEIPPTARFQLCMSSRSPLSSPPRSRRSSLSTPRSRECSPQALIVSAAAAAKSATLAEAMRNAESEQSSRSPQQSKPSSQASSLSHSPRSQLQQPPQLLQPFSQQQQHRQLLASPPPPPATRTGAAAAMASTMVTTLDKLEQDHGLWHNHSLPSTDNLQKASSDSQDQDMHHQSYLH